MRPITSKLQTEKDVKFDQKICLERSKNAETEGVPEVESFDQIEKKM